MFLPGSYKHFSFNTSQTRGVTSLSPAHQTCFPSGPLADAIPSPLLHPSSGLSSLSATFSQPAPHFISNQVLRVLLLKDASHCPWLSLSVTSAPGHNFIQFTWSPWLQTHPLNSSPCPITYPSLKCSGTSSYLNVQASNHDSRASWSGPGPSIWLISLTALCFLATPVLYMHRMVLFRSMSGPLWVPALVMPSSPLSNSEPMTCPPGRLAGSSSRSKWIRSPSPKRLCLLCSRSSHLLQNIVIRCFPP